MEPAPLYVTESTAPPMTAAPQHDAATCDDCGQSYRDRITVVVTRHDGSKRTVCRNCHNVETAAFRSSWF